MVKGRFAHVARPPPAAILAIEDSVIACVSASAARFTDRRGLYSAFGQIS
jgi:hypothetical protein